MRLERSKGAVMVEAGMFAAMAAAVGMVAFMVLGGFAFISGALFGVAVFVIVFALMWILMGSTMEPPRGPGNIEPSDTPLTRGTAGKAALSSTSRAPKAAASPAAKKAAPAPKPAAAATSAAVASDQGTKPELLDGPRGGDADDLKKIKGVGPKLEGVLHDIGVYHFDQIAGWSPSEVAWADENLVGFKGRVSRDDWVAQAKALADGGETEFSQRVDKGDVY